MKLFLSLVSIGAVVWVADSGIAQDTRLYEMRTYYANPGKLDALHARFRDHTVKLFEKHGMVNVGYWVPQENADNSLIYILSYADEAARDTAWQGFRNDEDWKAVFAESTKDGRLVKKVDSVYLRATNYSPVIQPSVAEEPRLFELRTYVTNPGKLDGLHSRFRDHTTKLFEEHGLPQFGYWTPIREQDGAANKLIYILAVRDRAARDAGFDSFRQDARWQKARAESEADGPLLVKNGVKSVLMVPTDYSSTK